MGVNLPSVDRSNTWRPEPRISYLPVCGGCHWNQTTPVRLGHRGRGSKGSKFPDLVGFRSFQESLGSVWAFSMRSLGASTSNFKFVVVL